MINALKKQAGAILFIDEIHTIVGAGATSGGSMDASNILKPVLAQGKLRCIGSTTYEEYRSYFERDRALARRFQKIEIDEPTIEQTLPDPARPQDATTRSTTASPTPTRRCAAAAELSAKHINDRRLPDKAIDVIDETAAAIKILPASRAEEDGAAARHRAHRRQDGAHPGAQRVELRQGPLAAPRCATSS